EPLRREQIRRVVDLQIAHLAGLMAKNGLSLEVSEAARQEIANRGYDPSYGARPLKRVIQQQLQNPLAAELLRGDYPEGATVTVDWRDEEFLFDAEAPTPLGS
ncbi:MAG: ATP-dependent chaperone ClpB, partial [Planctomycetota bacterium]